MTIYQRLFNEDNVKLIYISPYAEFRIDANYIYFCNNGDAVVRLKIDNPQDLIEWLIQGVPLEVLHQKLFKTLGSEDKASAIIQTLVRYKIIE